MFTEADLRFHNIEVGVSRKGFYNIWILQDVQLRQDFHLSMSIIDMLLTSIFSNLNIIGLDL